MGAPPILELRSISARKASFQVLREISFSVGEGETAIFRGHAGSGKTSLLKAAAGILIPSQGELLYRGGQLSRFSRREELEFRRRSGFVFQDAALWANQSLYDNLALPFKLHEPGAPRAALDAAVRKAAELAGCEEDLRLRPAELSSGERRLVGLARALVLEPELIFLDEPLSNLDEEAADRVRSLLLELRRAGKTLLIVSGSSELARSLADRIGVIRAGSLLAYGSYEEALGWSGAAVKGVAGRLKARRGPPGPPELPGESKAEGRGSEGLDEAPDSEERP